MKTIKTRLIAAREGTGGVMTSAMMMFFSVSFYIGLGLRVVVMTAISAYAEEPKVVAVPGSPILLLSNFDLGPLGYTVKKADP